MGHYCIELCTIDKRWKTRLWHYLFPDAKRIDYILKTTYPTLHICFGRFDMTVQQDLCFTVFYLAANPSNKTTLGFVCIGAKAASLGIKT